MRNWEPPTLLPVATAAAVLLLAVPLAHPLDSCTEWLMEWGRLYPTRGWVLVHVAAAAGFLLAACWGLLAGALVRPTGLSVLAGAALGAGCGMLGVVYPLHATAVGSLGQAFNGSSSHETRTMLRTVADSWMAYDVAVGGMASTLFSGGAVAMTFHLWRARAVHTAAALLLAGTGGVWAAQYYGVFNRLGFSLPESWRWLSACGWILASAWLAERLRREAGGASPRDGQQSSQRAEAEGG